LQEKVAVGKIRKSLVRTRKSGRQQYFETKQPENYSHPLFSLPLWVCLLFISVASRTPVIDRKAVFPNPITEERPLIGQKYRGEVVAQGDAPSYFPISVTSQDK
jgi:hypothetical protein